MTRLIMGLGMFLDGSLCLCGLFGETGSFPGTLALVMTSTIFTTIAVNWATIVWEAEQQPEVLRYGKDDTISPTLANESQVRVEKVVEEVPLRSVSGQSAQ